MNPVHHLLLLVKQHESSCDEIDDYKQLSVNKAERRWSSLEHGLLLFYVTNNRVFLTKLSQHYTDWKTAIFQTLRAHSIWGGYLLKITCSVQAGSCYFSYYSCNFNRRPLHLLFYYAVLRRRGGALIKRDQIFFLGLTREQVVTCLLSTIQCSLKMGQFTHIHLALFLCIFLLPTYNTLFQACPCKNNQGRVNFSQEYFSVTHTPLVRADKTIRQDYTDICDRTPPALINAEKTSLLWRRG